MSFLSLFFLYIITVIAVHVFFLLCLIHLVQNRGDTIAYPVLHKTISYIENPSQLRPPYCSRALGVIERESVICHGAPIAVIHPSAAPTLATVIGPSS